MLSHYFLQEHLFGISFVSITFCIKEISPNLVKAVLAAEDEKPEAKPRRRRRRFTCKATSSAGKLKANIIISKKDAERIAEADKKEKFFKNANVYVIMDSSIGGTESRMQKLLEAILADT